MNDPSSNEEKQISSRRRKSVPKVRTGCATCKYVAHIPPICCNVNTFRKRHMKCDERVPFCRNCEDFRVQCPGYPTKEPVVRRPLMLFPKPQPSLTPMAGGIPFADASEHRYFTLAFQDVGPDVTNVHLKLPLIIKLMVQSSRSEESLRMGMAAIGAMKEWTFRQRRRSTLVGDMLPARKSSWMEAVSHRTWAMHEYSQVLESLRESSDLRTILVGCWLVFYFENLCGSVELAAAHIETGFRLLQDWLLSHDDVPSSSSRLSPHPNIIEDNIISAFMGLDTELSIFTNRLPLPFHLTRDPSAVDLSRPLPTAFSSIQEAHTHLQRIMTRIHRYAGTPQPEVPFFAGAAPIPVSDSAPVSLTYEDHSKHLQAWSIAFSSFESSVYESPLGSAALLALTIHHLTTSLILQSTTFAAETEHDSLLPYYNTLLNLCTSLVTAFPYININNNLTPARRDSATQAMSNLRLTQPPVSPLSPNNFNPPIFRRSVSLPSFANTPTQPPRSTSTGDIHSKPTQVLNPSLFDIMIPLSRICRHCRHPLIRRAAIHLLRSPAVDADEVELWGAPSVGIIAASVGQWLVDVEEENMSTFDGERKGKEVNHPSTGTQDWRGSGGTTSWQDIGSDPPQFSTAEPEMPADRDRVKAVRVIIDLEARKGRVSAVYPARRDAEGKMEERDGEISW